MSNAQYLVAGWVLFWVAAAWRGNLLLIQALPVTLELETVAAGAEDRFGPIASSIDIAKTRAVAVSRDAARFISSPLAIEGKRDIGARTPIDVPSSRHKKGGLFQIRTGMCAR